ELPDRFKPIEATKVALSKSEISIQNELKSIVSKNQNAFITVIILESARHNDFGVNENQQTLTPFFNQLRSQGIYFENAYSTSKVTRAAQEAVLCGYYGNEFNSLMRHRQHINYTCLPSAAGGIFQTHYSWIHGGKFSFDQQGHFWQK